MSDIRYTKEHEWVRVDGEIATVGITNHAQQQLGDVVFVELPEVGREVAQKAAMAVVESVKAASDVYAPISGKVVEVNAAAERRPGAGQRRCRGRGLVLQARDRQARRARRPDGRRCLSRLRREPELSAAEPDRWQGK